MRRRYLGSPRLPVGPGLRLDFLDQIRDPLPVLLRRQVEHDAFQDPAMTVALAAAAGMLAQAIARDVVHPGTFGDSLHSLVGFAVVVNLFEGGMNLSVDRLGDAAHFKKTRNGIASSSDAS